MRKSPVIITILLATCLFGSSQADNRDPAWTALHNLDIRTARPLFESQAKKDPNDLTALRGLLLSAAFDLDNDAQIRAISDMVKTDPGNPMLLAIYEHLASELALHAAQLPTQKLLSEALHSNATGGARYTSLAMLESYYKQTLRDYPGDFLAHTGGAPGAWVLGPFDNQSNIAAYRNVPAENDRMDTLAKIIGKEGYRCHWTWVPADRFGNIGPANAYGTERNSACQSRSFFILPQPQPVFILLGGAFCGRILVDGATVANDPIFRNAYVRGGVKVNLGAGAHEVELVLASEEGIPYSISVTDTAYLPIEGLQWVRFAETTRVDSLPAEQVHPIFESFDAWAAKNADLPDLKYWTKLLRTYNGYAPEVIRELEEQRQNHGLSLLESLLLYKALTIHNESDHALKVLTDIAKSTDNPAIAVEWLRLSVTNQEASIRAFDSLSTVYPNRCVIDILAAMKPLLNSDVPGMIALIRKLVDKYPNECAPRVALSGLYQSSIGDQETAYQELNAYCRQCDLAETQLQQAPAFLAKLGRHDEALKLAAQLLHNGPLINDPVVLLLDVADEVNRGPEFIPVLDSLIKLYPGNVYLYALLNTIYKRAGKLDLSNKQLDYIHRLKPTAILPWQQIDSLHHNIPFDSLFGRIDVMALWDVVPTPAELAAADNWMLIDRVQKIVFDGGVAVQDFHFGWVLLNQDAVSRFQSTNLGFIPGENFYTLLSARRLRQGQPPLEAEQQNGEVVFKDLKPGDAVEIHYRYWSGQSGDLWRDWWDSYEPLSETYQRYWEYTIITDREDLRYVTMPPATSPKESRKFGYRILSWSGQKTAGVNCDGALLPRYDEMMGSIYVTSLPDWEPIRTWCSSVTEAILADNPRTVKLARDLTRGADTDRKKLDALYRYVTLEIPYQAIGFDYSGSIPRQPDQVLLNQWGDCKDKAHLLVSMLRTAGIAAWPELVLTRSEGSRLPLPQFAFDHEIIGCLIDGDTVHIDPSDLTADPLHTVTFQIAGQPCLPITPKKNNGISSLPTLPADQYSIHTELSATVADTGASPFTCERVIKNTSAGQRRDYLRGKSPADLKTELAEYFSDLWNTPVELDSLSHDKTQSVDSIFHETLHGQLRLNVNLIGRASLITLPDFSSFETSLPSNLLMEQAKGYPAALDPYCGTFTKTLNLTLPATLGEPQLADPISLTDSLYSFVATSTWDKTTRLLTLDYKLVIEQGRCDRVKFADFAKAVIKTFSTPVLCQQL